MASRPTVAFWPRTTRLDVASYRIRCANVRDALAARGMETVLIPPHGPDPSAPAPRALVLVKNFTAESLLQAKAWRDASGTRLIVDLCDNPFFEGDSKDRAAGWAERIAEGLDLADTVVTPSSHLRDLIAARLRPDMSYAVIPDAVETPPAPNIQTRLANLPALLRIARLRRQLERLAPVGRRLVWFGISGTRKAANGLLDLATLADTLNAHHALRPISLTVVTDHPWRHRGVLSRFDFPILRVAWNRWTVDGALAAHDVALIPIRRNEYNDAKSANRMTTAFANGLAVCATAIPSYEPFRSIARLDDWETGLAGLMDSPEARRDSVHAARRIVATEYAMPVVAARWMDLLTSEPERETVNG